MHDTAYKIGGLVVQTYCPAQQARILEVGSYAVNGALRDHATQSDEYIGLDIEAGPGVDVVIEPGQPFPLEDDHFDLVLASSAFEHDSAFWVTFLEMCRKAKPGGHVYFSAPSNGTVHRYPQDNWRFYPDSGLALMKWAKSQGQNVRLVESFVAEREGDIWNDFVAVFRKGPARKKMNEDFVHAKVACSNVITWQSDEVVNRRDETEDMVLIASARETAARLQEELVVREEGFASERAALSHRLAEIESTLRQRQEEITQAWAELAAEREAKAALQAELEQLVSEGERRLRKLEEADAWVFKLARDRQVAESYAGALKTALLAERRERGGRQNALERIEMQLQATAERERRAARAAQHAQSRIDQLSETLAQAQERASELEGEAAAVNTLSAELQRARHEQGILAAKVSERFNEIAMLTQLLGREESKAKEQSSHVEWLREVNRVLMSGRWWWTLMPAPWRRRRELRSLSRRGLFDGQAYLAMYPDVMLDGMDPLRHYIFHGMIEGRSRTTLDKA